MRYRPELAAGLLAGLLMASCAQVSPLTAVPPAGLLGPCTAPSRSLKTNADLVLHVLDLRTALQSCDDDKTALREWSRTLKD